LGGYLLDVSGGSFTIVFSYLGALMFASAAMIWLATPYAECTL
jgi:hypothetical protein